jgi:hypothetical protein
VINKRRDSEKGCPGVGTKPSPATE